jgi:hypothetical protein
VSIDPEPTVVLGRRLQDLLWAAIRRNWKGVAGAAIGLGTGLWGAEVRISGALEDAKAARGAAADEWKAIEQLRAELKGCPTERELTDNRDRITELEHRLDYAQQVASEKRRAAPKR